MTKLFKPLFSLWRTWKKTGNLNVAYHLLPEVYSPDINTSVHKKGDEVELTAYQKKFSRKQIALFGKHGELLLKYIKAGSVAFEKFNGHNEVLSINRNGKTIRLNVFNYDNLKVIEEIFIDQLYDFHAQEKFVVCDVGMNVAVSVLYFASFDNVEKVYGYEPFLQTFKRASENIDLNAGLKQKIETFNYGLGNTDEWLEVPLPEDGFLGGSTTKDFIDELPAELKKQSVKVEIKNVCNVIQKIKQTHPEQRILLKLDCEGAEYDIIQELEMKNMINEIAVFMIEFHYKGKKELVETLQRNNFFIMSPVSDEVNTFGMLYAFKLKA